MKDLFSDDSSNYAQYRPGYPPDVLSFLMMYTKGTRLAWDCGTGNGQFASLLSQYFLKIYATDISQSQLDHAIRLPNVFYQRGNEAQCPAEDQSIDLVTVAQACHWFDISAFYHEVNRVLKPGGSIALIGYHIPKTAGRLGQQIEEFYRDIVGPFWEPERAWIDKYYQGLRFPFPEIQCPSFEATVAWDKNQLLGYLRTWSAVKAYQKAHNSDPVTELMARINLKPSGQKIEFRIPYFMRLGFLI
jgi:ubiquinone/menaquinone biosynthesis C-methylase UbiE